MREEKHFGTQKTSFRQCIKKKDLVTEKIKMSTPELRNTLLHQKKRMRRRKSSKTRNIIKFGRQVETPSARAYK